MLTPSMAGLIACNNGPPGGGVPAASETVASGRFPLARELNLVTNAEPSTLATEFIGFTRSPEVRGLFQEYAFVPVD